MTLADVVPLALMNFEEAEEMMEMAEEEKKKEEALATQQENCTSEEANATNLNKTEIRRQPHPYSALSFEQLMAFKEQITLHCLEQAFWTARKFFVVDVENLLNCAGKHFGMPRFNGGVNLYKAMMEVEVHFWPEDGAGSGSIEAMMGEGLFVDQNGRAIRLVVAPPSPSTYEDYSAPSQANLSVKVNSETHSVSTAQNDSASSKKCPLYPSSLSDMPPTTTLTYDAFSTDISLSSSVQGLLVVGDLHGNFTALLNALKVVDKMLNAPKGTAAVVFLGDYVDRGLWSFEVFLLILLYRLHRPDMVYMLKGNHESVTSIDDGFNHKMHEIWPVDTFPESCPVTAQLYSPAAGFPATLTRQADGQWIEEPVHPLYWLCLDLWKYLPISAIVTLNYHHLSREDEKRVKIGSFNQEMFKRVSKEALMKQTDKTGSSQEGKDEEMTCTLNGMTPTLLSVSPSSLRLFRNASSFTSQLLSVPSSVNQTTSHSIATQSKPQQQNQSTLANTQRSVYAQIFPCCKHKSHSVNSIASSTSADKEQNSKGTATSESDHEAIDMEYAQVRDNTGFILVEKTDDALHMFESPLHYLCPEGKRLAELLKKKEMSEKSKESPSENESSITKSSSSDHVSLNMCHKCHWCGECSVHPLPLSSSSSGSTQSTSSLPVCLCRCHKGVYDEVKYDLFKKAASGNDKPEPLEQSKNVTSGLTTSESFNESKAPRDHSSCFTLTSPPLHLAVNNEGGVCVVECERDEINGMFVENVDEQNSSSIDFNAQSLSRNSSTGTTSNCVQSTEENPELSLVSHCSLQHLPSSDLYEIKSTNPSLVFHQISVPFSHSSSDSYNSTNMDETSSEEEVLQYPAPQPPTALVSSRRIFIVHGGLTPMLPTPLLSEYSALTPFDITFEQVDYFKMRAQRLDWNRMYGTPMTEDFAAESVILNARRRNRVFELALATLWGDPRGLHKLTEGRPPFGITATERFVRANRLDLIVRGHEATPFGSAFSHDSRIMTIFSSHNYYGGESQGRVALFSLRPPIGMGVDYTTGLGDRRVFDASYGNALDDWKWSGRSWDEEWEEERIKIWKELFGKREEKASNEELTLSSRKCGCSIGSSLSRSAMAMELLLSTLGDIEAQKAVIAERSDIISCSNTEELITQKMAKKRQKDAEELCDRVRRRRMMLMNGECVDVWEVLKQVDLASCMMEKEVDGGEKEWIQKMEDWLNSHGTINTFSQPPPNAQDSKFAPSPPAAFPTVGFTSLSAPASSNQSSSNPSAKTLTQPQTSQSNAPIPPIPMNTASTLQFEPIPLPFPFNLSVQLPLLHSVTVIVTHPSQLNNQLCAYLSSAPLSKSTIVSPAPSVIQNNTNNYTTVKLPQNSPLSSLPPRFASSPILSTQYISYGSFDPIQCIPVPSVMPSL